jgi:hypothetical protein
MSATMKKPYAHPASCSTQRERGICVTSAFVRGCRGPSRICHLQPHSNGYWLQVDDLYHAFRFRITTSFNISTCRTVSPRQAD